MAKHFDRHYCGSCHVSLKLDAATIKANLAEQEKARAAKAKAAAEKAATAAADDGKGGKKKDDKKGGKKGKKWRVRENFVVTLYILGGSESGVQLQREEKQIKIVVFLYFI